MPFRLFIRFDSTVSQRLMCILVIGLFLLMSIDFVVLYQPRIDFFTYFKNLHIHTHMCNRLPREQLLTLPSRQRLS